MSDEIRIDGMVLGFTTLVTLGVAFVLSFAPRLPKEGTLGGWVAAGAARVSGSLRKQRMQRALVVAQIAVSVVLLAGAGLLTRTMLRLSEVMSKLPGFEGAVGAMLGVAAVMRGATPLRRAG